MKIVVNPRTFTFEVSEKELNVLRMCMGNLTDDEIEGLGLDQNLQSQMYYDFAGAEDGE